MTVRKESLLSTKKMYIQRVDNSGNVTENSQEDVDEEIGAATTLKEYTERRKEDGDNDLDDVSVAFSQRCFRLLTS